MTLPNDPVAYLTEHYVYEISMLREALRCIQNAASPMNLTKHGAPETL